MKFVESIETSKDTKRCNIQTDVVVSLYLYHLKTSLVQLSVSVYIQKEKIQHLRKKVKRAFLV